VDEFRQLCLFRRQKKWVESDTILKTELPRSIASWSESFQAEPSVKRSRLDAMFQTEQRRIDDAWLVQELMAARLNEQFLPAICTQVAQEVRSVVAEEMAAQDRRLNTPARSSSNVTAGKARVAFDDIPGVIDLVLAEDRIRENARRFETTVCQ
jgi:hypothetical protein